jgi:hypothetical protein
MQKLVRMLLCVTALSSILLIGPTYSQTTPTTPPPGTSTGKAIGTAISTAISTAFPGISSIIKAIWPGSPTQNKKQPDATTATANLQQQSTQALAQLAKVSGDLSIVTVFLSNCVVAEDNIVAMRTFLQGKTSINASDKLQLQNYWNLAKGRIQNLKSAEASIDGLDDPNIRVTLRAVADANSGLLDNVTNNLNGSALNLLGPDLATLDSQLSAVNALSGEIIGEVSLALKSVQTKAAGGQSIPTGSSEFQKAQHDLDSVVSQRIRMSSPN